jgi:hypothetical protein
LGVWQEKGRGVVYAYASHGVRPTGLNVTTAEISSWTGHQAVALYLCSITLFYALVIACVAVTALRAKDPDQRKTALKILKILTGYGGSTRKKPGGAP